MDALADAVALLLVLVLAAAAAIAPQAVIAVGLPALALHRVWASHRRGRG
jgi:hypothetical protein